MQTTIMTKRGSRGVSDTVSLEAHRTSSRKRKIIATKGSLLWGDENSKNTVTSEHSLPVLVRTAARAKATN